MDTTWSWSLSATVNALMAVAALTLGWAIARRTSQRQQAWLLAAQVWLAAHYAAMAVDAFLHASGATKMPSTMFSICGQTFAAFGWTCLCLYLLAVVQRYAAPGRVDRGMRWPVIFAAGIFTLLNSVSLARLFYAIAAGAPAAEVQREILRASETGNSFAAMWILAPAILFNVLFQRLPEQERTGWVQFMAPGVQLTSLHLTVYPPIHHESPEISRNDFKALATIYLTGFLLLLLSIFRGVQYWTPALIFAATALRVLLLPSVMGLVYYQTRFSFFDLVLKRGTLFVALGIVTCAAANAVPRLETAASRAVFAAGATIFVCGSAAIWDRGDRLLDRIIFNRPNYRAELQSIGEQMARCTSRDSLIAMVVERLRRTLRADSLQYAEQVNQPAPLAVRIGAPGHARGFLLFGPRWRGQQYGSEDLNFIDAVAAQFAASLENFETRELQQLVSTAELRALRAQINPHFLFNALNTLAEMAHSDSGLERAILNLSRVFRYTLDSTRREAVPLRDEIAAIRAYLEIEAIRFEDKLKYSIAVPEELMETPVPPMLIQPLVENALKHGIAPKLGDGSVEIVVSAAGRGVRVAVRDDGVGFEPELTARNVGLDNVRTRVEKAGGTWELRSRPGAGTEVSLEVIGA